MVRPLLRSSRWRRLRPVGALSLATLMLAGCNMVVLNPAGDVAKQQADLILWSTGLMLLIIVPVMVLIGLFAWRYRETNEDATYAPDWDHSTGLELIIWAAPLVIVIALGALTWVGTHTLDPYRPLSRTGPTRMVAAGAKPLEIDVVSLDWKWLFIYPEQGIATVNRLAVPVDRPVHFRMTSSSVMNTFWVPSMAGMIYTMPGMETSLHAVMNKAGRFDGRSGNYSGAGFSGMTFAAYALPQAQFDRFVADVRAMPRPLDLATYRRLERPSENVPPLGFGSVDRGLYTRIVMMCVRPGVPCMNGAMAEGRKGGMNGVAPPVNDRPVRPDEAKGALTRDPEDKGSAPSSTVPRGNAPGAAHPGHPANRNLTWLQLPHRPLDATAMPA